MLGHSLAPYSGILCALTEILRFIGIATKSSRLRWVLFLLILLLSYLVVRYGGSDNKVNTYVVGCTILATLLNASDHLLITDVQKELRLQNQKEHDISQAPLGSRCVWALKLMLSPRGIGWVHEPKQFLAQRPKSSRSAFLTSRTLGLLACILVSDIGGIHNRWNPAWRPDGPSLFALGLFGRVSSLTYPIIQIAQMNMPILPMSMITVACGIYEPEDWVHLFGSPFDAYTLARFWGRSWHQMFRRPTQVHGKFISQRILGLQPRTSLDYFVQVYTAFALTALLHAAGEYMVVGWWTGGALRFFMIQAPAMTIEHIVLSLARGMGLKSSPFTKLLGYVWVLSWFLYCLPSAVEPVLRVGMGMDISNFSLIEGLLYGKYFYP